MDRRTTPRFRPRRLPSPSLLPRASRIQFEPLESRTLLTTGEVVRNGGLEGTISASDWVMSANWGQGSSNYHGGAKYAYFGDTASGTAANSIAGSMYQQLTIPATMVAPTLTFWSKVTTAETTTTTAKDTLVVSIKDSTGATTLANLVTISNVNGVGVTTTGTRPAYTATGKYTPYTITLPTSLIGQTVRINFAASTDASNATMFRIDDVSLAEPVPQTPGTSKQVVGYYPDYRYTSPSNIDLGLLTHVNYFSLGFGSTGVLTAPSSTFNSHVDAVVAAAHAKGVTVSITTGPSQPYATMAADPAARAKLALDLKNYIVAHNLDGVDIDWEPPSTGANQYNYSLLIDDLYAQLHPLGKKITAASNPWTKEIPVLAVQKMDWVNVMCYDFAPANHSTLSASTGSMDEWFYYGVPKNKLTMGVPFYGRYGTTWSSPPPAGEVTTTAKTYSTIVNDYKTLNGSYPAPDVDNYTDANGNVTYFNGVTTMEKKMAFLRDNGYAGAMIWELGQDHWDANGKYDPYSLLPVISSMLRPPAWMNPASGSLYQLVGSTLNLHAGSATFTANATGANPNLDVTVFSGASVTFNASQNLKSLTINSGGAATLAAGGSRLLYLAGLTIGGKLDLKDNDLAINYTGSSPRTTINGYITTGRNGGSWNGASGIVTTSASNLTTLGISEASQALHLSGSQTKLWNGQTVDSTTVLVKFTYNGDVDLSGRIDGDDYFILDVAAATPGTSGWWNGDFSMDGKINGDDYFVLDSNIGRQGVVL